MSRSLRALVLVLAVAACGGNNEPPQDMDNACAIANERNDYMTAMRLAQRKWGVPVHVQMATIYQESKFISDAKTPRRYALGFIPRGRQSSAFGYAQAIDGTWEEYQKDTGRYGARRDDMYYAADFIGWYMAGSNRSLGISLSDAKNQYLAYHEGRTGYSRGTHKGKSWLLRIAAEVGQRSERYRRQLINCGKA